MSFYIAGIAICILGGGIVLYMIYAGTQKVVEKNNQLIRDYVNSVTPTNDKAEDNTELMSQMRPSDEVVKYVGLKCSYKERLINGYIAVTKERLIFKTLAVGDSTQLLDNPAGNNASFRFDVKEETANIPIKKVTSMSSSTQSVSLDAGGCSVKHGQGGTLYAHVLNINAQGVIYKLFLGKCEDVASEFSKTFISMTRDEE